MLENELDNFKSEKRLNTLWQLKLIKMFLVEM